MIYWSKEESCVHAPPGWLIQIQRTVRAGQTQQGRQDAPGSRANRRRMKPAGDLGAETEVIQAHHPSPGAFGPERARVKFPAVQHSGRTPPPHEMFLERRAVRNALKHQPIPRLISSEEADVGGGEAVRPVGCAANTLHHNNPCQSGLSLTRPHGNRAASV